MDIELDFEDTSLGDSTSVDTVIDPIIPEAEPVKVEEPKKRGPKPKGTTDTPPKEEVVEEPLEVVEPEETPAGEEDENLIFSMAKKMGIELPEGVEFEDTEEGLAEFNEYASDIKADIKLNNKFESMHPIAGNFFDYMEMLGEDATPEQIKAFFTSVNPEINYNNIDLNSEDVQKAVMKTFYKKMEYTDEEIKTELEDAELAGTLKRQSETASKKLAAMQEKENAVEIEKQKEVARIQKENTQRFFGSVKNIIESGKVNNFNIPVIERKAIFDYDATGQFMQDINSALKDPEKRVELAIALKNKFSLNKYIQAAAATQKATSLRDKVKSSQGKMKSGAGASVDNSAIDWDSL